jgi:DNA-binding beta-propeller fold protein YncE
VENTFGKKLLIAALVGCAVCVVVGTASPNDLGGEVLLVVNKDDQTLSIVDPESGQQLATIPVGGVTGHEVAASPDGHTAWVPIYGNSGVGSLGTDGRTVSVIDLKARKQIASIDFGEPSRRHCAVFNAKNAKLYVTSELSRSIKAIDPVARRIVDSIPTGQPESHMLAITNDAGRAYTANVGPGTVSVIDLQRKTVLAVIPVSTTIQRIALSPDGKWVFTADQAHPELVVIDAQTNTITTRIPLPGIGYGMAPTPDGHSLVITQPTSRSVSVVSLDRMKVNQVIPVPSKPQEVLVRPDGQIAYVSCDESKQVVAIDLSSRRVVKRINVGAGADGLAWAPSPK